MRNISTYWTYSLYDPDRARKEATAKFIETLDKFGGRSGLEVKILAMPGTSDPDAHVRAFGDLRFGVAEFWKLTKEIDEGADPIDIAKKTIPLIVNVQDNMERLRKAERLADATKLPFEFIHRELFRQLDGNESKAAEERQAIAQQTSKALLQNPEAMDAILASAQVKLDAVAGAKIGYDPVSNLKSAQEIFEKIEAKTDTKELVTGFPVFDSLMGGIPREGVMISGPGKPHHGKSIWFDNLIVGMLDRNPDLQIFLHHVDDVALMRIPRILGIMSGLSSRDISNAGASFLTGGTDFEDRYQAARKKLMGWIKDERLILADQSKLVGDLTAHERWIKEIRRRNSKGQFISIGDNFHLFDMPGMDPGEGKVREMSKFIAGLPARHGITTMFSMELPKDILKPGVRPKYTDSKNSGGIAFDSKVNMNIYQEYQDLDDDSLMTWKSRDHMVEIVGPDGSKQMMEKTLPIIEVIVDKNKFTGVKQTVFYRLEPISGRMEECSPEEQLRLRTSLTESIHQRAAAPRRPCR